MDQYDDANFNDAYSYFVPIAIIELQINEFYYAVAIVFNTLSIYRYLESS